MIKIDINTLYLINKSKKKFFFYNLGQDKEVTDFVLTNDFKKGETEYDNILIVENIKNQVKQIQLKQ